MTKYRCPPARAAGLLDVVGGEARMLFAWKVVHHAEVGRAVVNLLHDLCRAEERRIRESPDRIRRLPPDPASAKEGS